jgi:hypothetical protein
MQQLLLPHLLKVLVDIVLLLKQIVQLQQIDEVIGLFGDNHNGNLAGEIVLGMFLSIKM